MFQDVVEPCLSRFHARANARVRISLRRGCDSKRPRGVFHKCACYPSLYKRVVLYRMVTAARFPLAYRDIIYPHMSIYGPSIRNGSVGRRGSSAILWYQEGYRDIISSGDGETLVLYRALRYELVDEIFG